MDKIFIKNLRVLTTIGIHAWEKAIKQPVLLNIEFLYNTKDAVLKDDIQNAVDYFALTEHVKNFLEKNSYNLIESLTHHLAENLLATFQLPWIKIELTKLHAIDNAEGVSITVEKGNSAQ